MTEKIMAFDPGSTTGVAIQEGTSLTLLQLRGLEAVWDELHRVEPDMIIYEDFLYQRRRDKVVLTPVEVIGVLKLYANLNEVLIRKQSAAIGKSFWTDRKIKKLGLWREGSVHAMDALRHLLYFRAFSLKDQSLLRRLKDD